MKDVVVFEDGKSSRGRRVRLIKRGNKRVLIEMRVEDFGDDPNNYKIDQVWFKLWIAPWSDDKKEAKHNNKRKSAMYIYEQSNEFYTDYYQSDECKLGMKEYCSVEYYEELYGKGE